MTASSSIAAPRERTGGWALDTLRFFAAFFIVLFHAGGDAPTALDQLSPIFSRGYLATDFFLILSGFVLGVAYGPRAKAGGLATPAFMRTRLTRIWPAHAIVLVAFAAMVAGLALVGLQPPHPDKFHWTDWLAQLALIQAWGVTGAGSGWNLPTWTLSALLVCYLAFPSLWRAVEAVRWPRALLAAVLALVVVGDLAAHLLAHQTLYEFGPERLGLVRAAPFFAVGVCVARLCQAQPIGTRVGLALSVGGLMLFVASQTFGRMDFLSIVAIAMVLRGASGLPKRTFAPATLAGRVSFSLFITHTWTAALWFGGLHLLVHATPSMPLAWVLWGVGLSASLGVAVAFDRFVDQPLQGWIKRGGWRGPFVRRRLATV